MALFRNRLVIVAATDEQIAIFQAKFTSPSTPKKLRARLPRNVAIGPVGALVWYELDLDDEKLWVHRRFFGEVNRMGRHASRESDVD